MNIHLVDGTYELFRHFFAMPPTAGVDGVEVAATQGVLGSILSLINDGATHVGVATDQVIESFRNELWPGYKTGDGIEPTLLAQFRPLERALEAMGVTVFAMVEFEADDALAAAAAIAARDPRVARVLICTPDKDLSQCVDGTRVVQFDRRARVVRDEDGVRAKFGVSPVSIPDYLALVGDSADGYPGLPGWGAKSASAVLAAYTHLEAIPPAASKWSVPVRGAAALSATLEAHRAEASLFRQLATLRLDAPTIATVDDLEWRGPRPEFEAIAQALALPSLFSRARALAARR